MLSTQSLPRLAVPSPRRTIWIAVAGLALALAGGAGFAYWRSHPFSEREGPANGEFAVPKGFTVQQEQERELSRQVRQSCHLAVASNEQMVVVARVENEGYVGFSVRPGYRRSLVEATSGSVLFAFQPPEVRQTWTANLKAAGTSISVLSWLTLSAQGPGFTGSNEKVS